MNNGMLWHYRLLPQLFRNKNQSLFQCEFCEMAKHHRLSFPSQKYLASKPFTMIHSDVRGPFRISTMFGKRWFVTFINDHTRLSWVFLLKDKFEVQKNVFEIFYVMVETLFNEKIKIFRSDNGREFFNEQLVCFFRKTGVVHQSSCTDTPNKMVLPKERIDTF